MTTKEMLQSQFDLVYRMVAAQTADLDQRASIASPEVGGNNANWILGHLTDVQNRTMALLGAAPVWTDSSLDRDWDEPVGGADDALDFETMRSAFLASRDRCVEAIGALTPEAMSQDGLPAPLGGTTTREGLLSFLAFHQAYHAGQLALARRFSGHLGVIKQPKG